MNEITIFESKEFGKLQIITDEFNNLWFIAKDICNALGYQDPSGAYNKHCKCLKLLSYAESTELKINNPNTNGTYIIPENDLYRLIMKSKLPSAERFQDWVTSEVLPSIRKTGSYSIEKRIPKTFGEALRLAADQQLLIESQQKQMELDKPKVEYYDQVAESKDASEMSAVAKTLDMGMGRNQMFEFLRNKKILRGNNEPYQQYMDCGYFRVIKQKYTIKDVETKISTKTLVYPKGEIFIRKLILEDREKQKQIEMSQGLFGGNY